MKNYSMSTRNTSGGKCPHLSAVVYNATLGKHTEVTRHGRDNMINLHEKFQNLLLVLDVPILRLNEESTNKIISC